MNKIQKWIMNSTVSNAKSSCLNIKKIFAKTMKGQWNAMSAIKTYGSLHLSQDNGNIVFNNRSSMSVKSTMQLLLKTMSIVKSLLYSITMESSCQRIAKAKIYALIVMSNVNNVPVSQMSSKWREASVKQCKCNNNAMTIMQ